MAIINGCNPELVDFFNLEDYVKNIKLEDFLLEHLEETNEKFNVYLTKLFQYDSYAVIYYLADNLNKEFKNSQAIENKYIKGDNVNLKDIFFDRLSLNHTRINELHKYATRFEEKQEYEYREGPVRVSSMTKMGEKVFWHGARAEDVKPFMDDFIKIYKTVNVSTLNTSPFLKSALVHLLFLRIHPYSDGNGRTARLVHNIKFTDSINRLYGMRLKICPLNISQNILINKKTYADRIDNIYFDVKHDTSHEINKWFEFILNMADEQIYYSGNRLKKLAPSLEQIARLQSTDKEHDYINDQISKMKIKKI